MHKSTFFLLFMALLFCVSGCSSTGGMIPVSDEMVATGSQALSTQVGYITDASAMKEKFVHDSLQNRDKQIQLSHKNDGFHMSFALIEIAPGVKALLPQDISYKEPARFDQPLPMAPSVHPGWHTLEKVGVAAINGTVIGLGINAASDVMKTGINAAGSRDVTTTNTSTVSPSDSHAVGPVDNSVGPVDNSNNAVDNRVGPVDNSNNAVDNSIGPVDNSTQPLPLPGE